MKNKINKINLLHKNILSSNRPVLMLKGMLSVLTLVLSLNANAQSGGGSNGEKPLAGGWFPEAQYPSRDQAVLGLRFSPGYAENKGMLGLDIGLIGNITTGTFIGTAISGGFNRTDGTTIAIVTQFAGLLNLNKGSTVVVGSQLTAGVNYNGGSAHIVGLQFGGIANLGKKANVYGLQLGLYNEANNIVGFQIGLINKAQDLHGIQIGLWNINYDGPIKRFPIINIGF